MVAAVVAALAVNVFAYVCYLGGDADLCASFHRAVAPLLPALRNDPKMRKAILGEDAPPPAAPAHEPGKATP